MQVFRPSLPGFSAPVSDEQETLLFLFPLLTVWPAPACAGGLTLPPPSGPEEHHKKQNQHCLFTFSVKWI